MMPFSCSLEADPETIRRLEQLERLFDEEEDFEMDVRYLLMSIFCERGRESERAREKERDSTIFKNKIKIN
jgi:hypothetical protein